MGKSLLSVRVTQEIIDALDQFAADMQTTRPQATEILLSKGLGRSRLEDAKAHRPIETERQEFGE